MGPPRTGLHRAHRPKCSPDSCHGRRKFGREPRPPGEPRGGPPGPLRQGRPAGHPWWQPRRLTPLIDVKDETGGVDVAYLGVDGEVIAVEHRDDWDGWIRDIGDGIERVALRLEVVLKEPGEHRIEVGTVGGHRILIDGVLVSEDNAATGSEVIINSTINNPPGIGRSVVVDDEPVRVVVEAEHRVTRAGGYGAIVRSAFRHRRPEPSDDAEIAAAVAAAGTSELVVVAVGTNEEVESEGWDRTSLQLPGRQNDLVEAVLDVAPDAVIVVNAGAPVILPWLDRARTVLWTWFPGQRAGDALAAVLAGDEEPAGRLPWTLPVDEADVPVPNALPVDGFVDYTEGLHVGYRAWEQPGRAAPAAPFGSGLGWSTWRYDSLDVIGFTADGDLQLTVTLTNMGVRTSRETVQVYLEPPAGGPERPVRWLAGFAGAHLAAGETRSVSLVVPAGSLRCGTSRRRPGPCRRVTTRSGPGTRSASSDCTPPYDRTCLTLERSSHQVPDVPGDPYNGEHLEYLLL